jgi:hypothetical protein
MVTVAAFAFAQSLPLPSRTVYRCENTGGVVYSDAACVGAKRVEVQPTRGLDRSSGAERVGADVRSERVNEAMANAMRPIFNESGEQRTKRHRRAKLPSGAQAQCRKLDDDIATLEVQEKLLSSAERAAVQQRLYGLRLQFGDLRC